jgi:hypothetical protein
MRRKITADITLRDLHRCRNFHEFFRLAYQERCDKLIDSFIFAALQAFPTSLLATLGRFLSRFYYECENPPQSADYQNPEDLHFEGPDAHRPFPACWFKIAKNGGISLINPQAPPEPHCAYVTSALMGGDPPFQPAAALHQANFVNVRM